MKYKKSFNNKSSLQYLRGEKELEENKYRGADTNQLFDKWLIKNDIKKEELNKIRSRKVKMNKDNKL